MSPFPFIHRRRGPRALARKKFSVTRRCFGGALPNPCNTPSPRGSRHEPRRPWLAILVQTNVSSPPPPSHTPPSAGGVGSPHPTLEGVPPPLPLALVPAHRGSRVDQNRSHAGLKKVPPIIQIGPLLERRVQMRVRGIPNLGAGLSWLRQSVSAGGGLSRDSSTRAPQKNKSARGADARILLSREARWGGTPPPPFPRGPPPQTGGLG